MELKEPGAMDAGAATATATATTKAFPASAAAGDRLTPGGGGADGGTPSAAPHLPKADFFDFVVAPDDAADHQQSQQFAKQMRTVSAFLGNGTTDPDSKETNNNSMLMSDIPTTTAADVTTFDTNFWSDKDTVKIETAILEDLNKYCWTNDEVNGVVQIHADAPTPAAKCGVGTAAAATTPTAGTTDGQIYTLTVLNGIDQSATWYRLPKDEDVSMGSPGAIDHLQAGLDIDSILGQMNSYSSSYSEGTMSPNTDGLIKSETYTYEDSGFADNKEEQLANVLINDTPLLEAHDFANNNNDWKLTNNNTQTVGVASTPDSLLRSALQGKAFVRYNGAKQQGGTTKGGEGHTELRRALATPPVKAEPQQPQQQQVVYLKDDSEHGPTIVAGVDASGKIVFEEHIPNARMETAENPSSTHNVEDIIFSQLDQPFPEDYEKLKRIANEVQESVNQYCQIDTSAESQVPSISVDQIGILYNINSPIAVTAPAVTSTNKPAKKKYSRSNSGKSGQASVQSATSTSNGVRKERSLHYCSICSKGFKDKYSVNVHIRTHTGEKPFTCSLCGKSFRQKAHLAKHYQTHIAQKNAAAAGGAAVAKGKAR